MLPVQNTGASKSQFPSSTSHAPSKENPEVSVEEMVSVFKKTKPKPSAQTTTAKVGPAPQQKIEEEQEQPKAAAATQGKVEALINRGNSIQISSEDKLRKELESLGKECSSVQKRIRGMTLLLKFQQVFSSKSRSQKIQGQIDQLNQCKAKVKQDQIKLEVQKLTHKLTFELFIDSRIKFWSNLGTELNPTLLKRSSLAVETLSTLKELNELDAQLDKEMNQVKLRLNQLQGVLTPAEQELKGACEEALKKMGELKQVFNDRGKAFEQNIVKAREEGTTDRKVLAYKLRFT